MMIIELKERLTNNFNVFKCEIDKQKSQVDLEAKLYSLLVASAATRYFWMHGVAADLNSEHEVQVAIVPSV